MSWLCSISRHDEVESTKLGLLRTKPKQHEMSMVTGLAGFAAAVAFTPNQPRSIDFHENKAQNLMQKEVSYGNAIIALEAGQSWH